MIVYKPYARNHTPGVVKLCQALDWPSYAEDSSVTHRALSSPGSTTVVALEGERVVALAQVLSDGVVQAHLSLVGVLPSHRRAGIAHALIVEAFRHAGGKWLDLVSEAGAEPFYRSFVHAERPGFRLYPAEGRRQGSDSPRKPSHSSFSKP